MVDDPKNEYVVKGDVTVNNKIVFKNQTIIMDVGTDNIQGYETYSSQCAVGD